MKTGQGKITLGKVTAASIIVLILLILNAPAIIPFVASISVSSNKHEIVGLQFVPSYEAETNNYLRGYAQSSTGVSGYSANVDISFENESVAIGGLVKIQIEINNTGTTLQKPYFYIVLVNNTGTAVSIFPQDTYFEQYSYKPSQWFESQYGSDFFTPLPSNGIQSTLAIPRQTMITGEGDFWNNIIKYKNGEIWFEKQIPADPSQIGQWTVWVFVFDDPYTDSMGKTLSSTNEIAYSTAFFNVTPLTPSQSQAQINNSSTLLLWASGFISVVLAAVSTFPLFKKLSPWIDARVHAAQVSGWWKSNQSYILFSATLLLVYIILFFLRT